MIETSIKKADILIEALPYIRAFRGKVMVIKYGGSSMDDEEALTGILEDLVFLHYVGVRPILVHGGGPLITERLRTRGVKTSFVNGRRVTDAGTMAVVEETLHELNGSLVRRLRALGAEAVGAREFGVDGIVQARPHADSAMLGFVGEVSRVMTGKLQRYLRRGRIPIVAPIGVGRSRQRYNINADTVACSTAAALRAEKLVMFTDVLGILERQDDDESLIPTLSAADVATLIERGVIRGGMIPKVEACVHALRSGVKKTHIIDAKIPHALLLEIFTKQGIGTEIVR